MSLTVDEVSRVYEDVTGYPPTDHQVWEIGQLIEQSGMSAEDVVESMVDSSQKTHGAPEPNFGL